MNRDDISLILNHPAYEGTLTKDCLWIGIIKENFLFEVGRSWLFKVLSKDVAIIKGEGIMVEGRMWVSNGKEDITDRVQERDWTKDVIVPPDVVRRIKSLEAELVRLKELNREMVAIIKEFTALALSSEEEDPIEVGCHCTDSGDAFIQCVWCRAKQVLAKAEGEVG